MEKDNLYNSNSISDKSQESSESISIENNNINTRKRYKNNFYINESMSGGGFDSFNNEDISDSIYLTSSILINYYRDEFKDVLNFIKNKSLNLHKVEENFNEIVLVEILIILINDEVFSNYLDSDIDESLLLNQIKNIRVFNIKKFKEFLTERELLFIIKKIISVYKDSKKELISSKDCNHSFSEVKNFLSEKTFTIDEITISMYKKIFDIIKELNFTSKFKDLTDKGLLFFSTIIKIININKDNIKKILLMVDNVVDLRQMIKKFFIDKLNNNLDKELDCILEFSSIIATELVVLILINRINYTDIVYTTIKNEDYYSKNIIENLDSSEEKLIEKIDRMIIQSPQSPQNPIKQNTSKPLPKYRLTKTSNNVIKNLGGGKVKIDSLPIVNKVKKVDNFQIIDTGVYENNFKIEGLKKGVNSLYSSNKTKKPKLTRRNATTIDYNDKEEIDYDQIIYGSGKEDEEYKNDYYDNEIFSDEEYGYENNNEFSGGGGDFNRYDDKIKYEKIIEDDFIKWKLSNYFKGDKLDKLNNEKIFTLINMIFSNNNLLRQLLEDFKEKRLYLVFHELVLDDDDSLFITKCIEDIEKSITSNYIKDKFYSVLDLHISEHGERRYKIDKEILLGWLSIINIGKRFYGIDLLKYMDYLYLKDNIKDFNIKDLIKNYDFILKDLNINIEVNERLVYEKMENKININEDFIKNLTTSVIFVKELKKEFLNKSDIDKKYIIKLLPIIINNSLELFIKRNVNLTLNESKYVSYKTIDDELNKIIISGGGNEGCLDFINNITTKIRSSIKENMLKIIKDDEVINYNITTHTSTLRTQGVNPRNGTLITDYLIDKLAETDLIQEKIYKAFEFKDIEKLENDVIDIFKSKEILEDMINKFDNTITLESFESIIRILFKIMTKISIDDETISKFLKLRRVIIDETKNTEYNPDIILSILNKVSDKINLKEEKEVKLTPTSILDDLDIEENVEENKDYDLLLKDKEIIGGAKKDKKDKKDKKKKKDEEEEEDDDDKEEEEDEEEEILEDEDDEDDKESEEEMSEGVLNKLTPSESEDFKSEETNSSKSSKKSSNEMEIEENSDYITGSNITYHDYYDDDDLNI